MLGTVLKVISPILNTLFNYYKSHDIIKKIVITSSKLNQHSQYIQDTKNIVIGESDLFIKRVSSSVFESSQTGIKMFTLHMIAHIPSNSSISTIRNEFTEFCDQFNLDAIMEPMK